MDITLNFAPTTSRKEHDLGLGQAKRMLMLQHNAGTVEKFEASMHFKIYVTATGAKGKKDAPEPVDALQAVVESLKKDGHTVELIYPEQP